MTFHVHLTVDGEPLDPISYESVKDCLSDDGLRTLFDGGHVGRCDVYRDGVRVTGVPGALATWSRFQNQISSNEKSLKT